VKAQPEQESITTPARRRDAVTAAQRTQAQLRKRILEGMYPPHAYLPSERELARDLGTSRLSISTAIASLVEEGLVVRHAGRGTRVLPVLDRLSTPVVGVVFGHRQEDFRPELRGALSTLDGILNTLTRFHCRYEVVSLGTAPDFHLEQLIERFGGLVIAGPVPLSFEEGETAEELAQRPLPMVIAKQEIEYPPEISTTWVDHSEPILRAVRTLSQFGHEHIGFVTREPSYAFYSKALDGYRTGLREMNLPPDEALIAYADQTDALSGYFAARHLLTQSTRRPTAIIAARDTLAEGVCRAIEEAALCIGHDVSVIGFDDITWSQRKPFLTTFREPCYDMGVGAAEMLVERIVDPALPPEKRKFETPFILRRSIGPPIDNYIGAHTKSAQAPVASS